MICTPHFHAVELNSCFKRYSPSLHSNFQSIIHPCLFARKGKYSQSLIISLRLFFSQHCFFFYLILNKTASVLLSSHSPQHKNLWCTRIKTRATKSRGWPSVNSTHPQMLAQYSRFSSIQIIKIGHPLVRSEWYFFSRFCGITIIFLLKAPMCDITRQTQLLAVLSIS